jgi:hypothetical protein
MLLLGLMSLPGAATAQDVGALYMMEHDNAGREPLGDPVETHAFAMCIARQLGGIEILEKVPHSRSETNFIVSSSRYQDTGCHPRNRRLVVGGRFLRGAAAEYLLEQPSAERADQPIFRMPNTEEFQRLSEVSRASIVFIQIGECTARANPVGVAALLATDVSTPAERAAFAGVTQDLAGCVPAGVSLRLPPLLIRAYLAEGGYRNLVADRARGH